MQTQNACLVLTPFVSQIGGKCKTESTNETITRAQQLNSAQLNATFESNADFFLFELTSTHVKGNV